MPALDDVLGDLAAEGDDLDTLVADLDAAGWSDPTPAPGWTIAHQIGHLAWTDDLTSLAATDPDVFSARLHEAITEHQAAAELDGYVDRAAAERGALAPAELLTGWRSGRQRLIATLRAVPDGTRLPWFGPPMSATSMATARIMETWAHGQDVADALRVARVPTARLRHVAHLGVRTRDFAYLVNDRTPPADPVRVELSGPDGTEWSWGAEDATQRVTGPALDFCLLVTQRRHRDDLAVTAVGAAANEWLGLAQAFAGAPGPGRQPGQLR